MQRTGRKGHAMFRVVVQDSRRTPTSGKIVASLGSYDPHSKAVQLNKERAQFYLDHGAQPSDRAAGLLKKEGVKLPEWVKLAAAGKREVRNPEKRRSTTPEKPAEETTEEPAEAEPTAAKEPEAAPEETAAEETTEPAVEDEAKSDEPEAKEESDKSA